jgi:hypothetical protein
MMLRLFSGVDRFMVPISFRKLEAGLNPIEKLEPREVTLALR